MKRRDFFKFTGKGFAALFAAVIVGAPKIEDKPIDADDIDWEKVNEDYNNFVASSVWAANPWFPNENSEQKFDGITDIVDRSLEFEADVRAAAEQIKRDLIRADELMFG